MAEEVRKLAEESHSAAQKIYELNTDIQSATGRAVGVVQESVALTEDGAEVVGQAREAFTAIGSSVDDINDRLDKLATLTTEVAAVAQQSSAAAQEVSASTQQTSAATQEVAGSARNLVGTAEELEELVSSFDLRAVGANALAGA